MHHFLFSLCIISLSTVFSPFIHIMLINGVSFLKANNIPLITYTKFSLFTHLSLDT